MTGPKHLRLTILGGFLGAGKSTWARHQLHVGGFGPAPVVLVNEAAGTPVDDQLLTGAAEVIVLAGGCACCAGQDALIAALRALCDRRSRRERLDTALLETSGLADPAAIVAALQADPVLTHHLRVAEVIVVVDALHGLDQLTEEPLARRQIACADRLILTKTDAAPPHALQRLRAALARLNAHAATSATVLGVEVALPPRPAHLNHADTGPADLALRADSDGPGRLFAAVVDVPPELDWAVFTLWLSALLHARGHHLVRVKGVIRTPAGRLLLQAVRRVVQTPELLPQGDNRPDNHVVFIGRGCAPGDLDRSMRGFLGLGAAPVEQEP